MLALWFPPVTLAEVTSTILLGVFALVNLALLKIKSQADAPAGVVTYPRAAPLAGFVACAAFLVFKAFS